MNEPIINISPSFQGSLTIEDLLATEATITFRLNTTSIKSGGLIFSIDFFQN